MKTGDGGCPHANTNERIQEYLDDCCAVKHGERPFVTSTLSRFGKDKWEAHTNHDETYYYAGNGDPKCPFTLFSPEIDVQKSKKLGSPAGALKFAEYLRVEEPLFQNRNGQKLYIEPSTGGKGIHPYVILNKLGADATNINSYYKRLQTYLTWRAEQLNADIEMVEVKGGCPVVSWDDGPTYEKSGTLMKLPRLSTPEKEQQFRNTVVLTVNRLSMFLHDWEESHQDWLAEHKNQNTVLKKEGRTQIVVPPSAGSISGKKISDEEIAKLPAYKELAAQMMAGTEIEVHGVSRAKVKTIDVAIFFLLSKCFYHNMNEDGSLPTVCFQKMWEEVRDDVGGRAFCPNRFCAMRNWLSSLPGCIDWRNMTYVPPRYFVDEDGNEKKIKGQACKWKLGHGLLEMLDCISSLYEGGKASLIITQSWIKSLRDNQLAPEDTPRPRIRQEIRKTPDDCCQIVGFFEMAA